MRANITLTLLSLNLADITITITRRLNGSISIKMLFETDPDLNGSAKTPTWTLILFHIPLVIDDGIQPLYRRSHSIAASTSFKLGTPHTLWIRMAHPATSGWRISNHDVTHGGFWPFTYREISPEFGVINSKEIWVLWYLHEQWWSSLDLYTISRSALEGLQPICR